MLWNKQNQILYLSQPEYWEEGEEDREHLFMKN